MSLQVASLSLEMITSLRPLLPRVRGRDKSLADQISRSASSVALNIAEAEYSDPGTKRSRLHTAAGSANETLMALQVAVAWGHLAEADAATAVSLLRRVLAMLWRLMHR